MSNGDDGAWRRGRAGMSTETTTPITPTEATTQEQILPGNQTLIYGLMVSSSPLHGEIWIPILTLSSVIGLFVFCFFVLKCKRCCRKLKCCAQALPDDGSAGSTVLYQRADDSKFHTL